MSLTSTKPAVFEDDCSAQGYQPAGHAPQPEASSSGRGQLQHSPNSYGRQQGPAPTGRSYVGPYPGSLPAAGGHRAADRPGGGTVVRGRGITLRLPPRPERPPSGQSPFPMSGVEYLSVLVGWSC